jgi:hypothetical protein
MFAVALVLAIAGFTTMELFWRGMGYTPSVTDGEDLWSYHRHRVESAGPETVLLLGRSRIKQGFVMEAWRDVAPDHDVIQLAVNGRHPIATLRDIADNTNYAGLVICTVTASSLLPELHDQQQANVDYYHTRWDPVRQVSRGATTVLQNRLVILLPDLLPQRVAPDLLRGDLEPQYLWTHPDRTEFVDYRNAVDLVEATANQLEKNTRLSNSYADLPGYQNWPAGLDAIEASVQRIQERGGRVLFFRTITTGSYWDVDEATFPRARFWDVFAQDTSGQALHFLDVPEMAAFECAEGSHLYYEDAVEFTKLLAREVRAAGLLNFRQAGTSTQKEFVRAAAM